VSSALSLSSDHDGLCLRTINQSNKSIKRSFHSFISHSPLFVHTRALPQPSHSLHSRLPRARVHTIAISLSVCTFALRPCHVISLSRSSPHLFVFTAYSLTHLQYSPYGDSHILSRCTKLFSPHFETKKKSRVNCVCFSLFFCAVSQFNRRYVLCSRFVVCLLLFFWFSVSSAVCHVLTRRLL